MKRTVALLAVIALVVVALGASVAVVWQSSDTPAGADGSSVTYDPTSIPEDSDPVGAPEGLERFYEQRIDWSECGDNDCGSLEVPLDYSRPDGDTISLSVLRVPAGKEAVASMVVNPGGPGAPGTSYASSASLVFGKSLRQHLDIVGFDPRGTGTSAAIDCLSDADLNDYLATVAVPTTPAQVEEFTEAAQEFGRGCADLSGNLVNHVSTIEAARDMDVLRAALGDSRLTYFGASYGTKLGATYAELFPERVGRLVLDGGVDVSIDSETLSLEQARGFETALRAYVQNCIDTAENCFLGDSVEEGLTTISDLLASIDDEPLEAGDRLLHGSEAFYGVVTPLYVSDYWFLLSQALKGALDGDGSALLELADMYASRSGTKFSDNSMEAIYAINCLDDPWSIPASQVPSKYDEFEEASPTFGKVFAWGLIGCSGSEGRTTEKPITIDGAGADPILVVGTTRDPATPYEWSVSLAEQLDSGVLLSRDGDGHTGYMAGNACVDETVESYLLEGEVPEQGRSC